MMFLSRFFWTAASIGCLLVLLPSQVLALSQPSGAAKNSRQRVFVSTPSRAIRRLVSECMTPRSQMHVLFPHTSTDEAITLLLSKGISGAPVVHPISGKLMGIISSSDFIFKDYAGALLNVDGSDENLEHFVEVAQKITGTTVEELMSRHGVLTIRSTQSMATAADIMARRNLHRLIVVSPDDEDELVGILTRADIMRDVMTTVRAALPERGTHDDDNSNTEKDEGSSVQP